MGVIFVDFTGLLFFSDIFDVILQLCYLPIDPLHSLIVLKVSLLKDLKHQYNLWAIFVLLLATVTLSVI